MVGIRRAAAADAPALTAVAHAAKRHWGYPEAWITLWRRELTLTPAFVERHPVYAALDGDTIVGVSALCFAGADCELEHCWVLPSRMGAGIGRRLLAHAVERCRAIGAPRLWITADPHAEAFYVRLGARRVGEVPSVPAGRVLPRLELPVAAVAPPP